MSVNPELFDKKRPLMLILCRHKNVNWFLSMYMQSVLQLPFSFSLLDNWRQLNKLGKVQDDIISLHQSCP